MTDADQVIEEICRSRCRMSEECDHDVSRYIEHLKELNSRYADQVRRYRKLRPLRTQVQNPLE